jgi:hypothetical protein
MQKYFPKSQGIGKLIRLSTLFTTIVTLSYSNTAQADVNGIPSNPDFPNAQYPYAQAPDACSGVTNIPDSNGEIRDSWGPVDFRGACNTHDKCYYTVGSNWNTCNERLFSDLRAACERDLKISFNVPAPTLSDPLRTRRVDGPPDPVRLSACYTIASGYYAGVQGGVALGVFDKAQDKQKRYESWVASVSNYRNFQLQTGTALEQTGDNWNFGVLPNGDLVGIKKSGTGSGKTEVHILSAASNYQSFRLQTGTALHETDNNFAFDVLPNGDLVAIKKSGTGSGKTEVHILSAASNYQSFRLQTGTALHETDNNFAFSVLPNGDLVAIKKSGTGSGKTEVHILSAQ